MRMKVWTAGLILLLCIGLFPLAVFGATDYYPLVSDGADLLTDGQEQELEAEFARIRDTYQVELIVVTVESLGTWSVDSYANRIYDTRGYGYGENQDGVMLLVAMESRDYRILANGLGSDAISNQELDEICDAVAAELSAGDYAQACRVFAAECEYQINGEINGFPFDFSLNLLIAVAVGLLVAIITTSIMLSQLKSVKPRQGAQEYRKENGMQMTRASELYLYSTMTRIPRQTDSGSRSGGRGGGFSGGGGSRKIGGGKF